MQYLPVILVAGIATWFCAAFAQEAGVGLTEGRNPLLDAQWKHRLLVVCTEDDGLNDPPLMTAQYDEAFKDWPGYIDRDLILVWLTEDYVMSWHPKPHAVKAATLLIGGSETDDTNLRARTGCIPETGFVSLIGKDGDVKLTSPSTVSNQDLFATIDAMPMRQGEMQQPKSE
ncbi:MAG: DUF4174 domain-containing protein [Pseudomonadota bacterium]